MKILVLLGDELPLVTQVADHLTEPGGWIRRSLHEVPEGDAPVWAQVGSSPSTGCTYHLDAEVDEGAQVVVVAESAQIGFDFDFIADIGPQSALCWLHSPAAFDELVAGSSQPELERLKTAILYELNCSSVEDAGYLLDFLASARSSTGILTDDHILPMIRCGMLVANPEEASVRGASYDLTLGDVYYSKGRLCRLKEDDPFMPIEPYDYAIVGSRDIVNLPRDVCARFGPKNHLFVQGVIQANGPQIDPGFRGELMCLLFNTSNAVVMLKKGAPYATLEFHRTAGVSSPYRGRNLGRGLLHYLPDNTMQGGINQLKKELEQVRSDSHDLQTLIVSVVSLILAVVAVLLAVRPFG